MNRWTPHAGTQRHLTCPSEDTGHSPQSGIGAGKPEPPRGLHSEHKCPFCPRVLVPTTTAQQGLVTWWVQGFLRPSGGQWALPPQQLASTPPPSLWGNVPRQQGSHSSRPTWRSLPCCLAKALFVCPGLSKALLSPIHALPGWHVDTRPDGQPRDWPPEHAALSGHRGTRRHQWESLELGVGGKADGGSHQRATFRAGGHGPKADSPTPPGWARCPQVSPA